MTQTGFQALVSIFSIAGLLILYRLSKALRVDRFRQDIFNLRDEMFMYAATGGISFDHPAYVTLRTTMNGYIRFGHQITWPYFVIEYLAGSSPRQYHTFNEQWNAGILRLRDDSEAQFRIKEYYNKLSRVAKYHFILMNLELVIPLLPIILLLKIVKKVRLFNSLRCRKDKLINNLLPEKAYSFGKI